MMGCSLPLPLTRCLLACAVIFSSAVLNAEQVTTPAQTGKFAQTLDPLIESKVDVLLAQMTVEEKVGQMRIFHARLGIDLGDGDQLVLSDPVKQKLKDGIAGIKNPGEFLDPVLAAKQNNLLQKYIIENSRLGIPALFITEAYNGVDAEGSTKFARPMNMAATWNTALTHQVWNVIGREARLRGLHICHSPEADIMRDPRFGRMTEGFSEDTHLTTEMVVAAVTGVQGDYSGLSNTHIGAVTKHFAGYGQVEGGRNFASVQISPRVLEDEILPPFKAAVQRGRTLGIMASHGDINGVASHANPVLLDDILRQAWGFNGYVVSDANDIARLSFFMGVAGNADEAALLGLRAGVDIDLYSEDAYARLPALLEKHPDIAELIDRSVRRVLRTKFLLGLFDNPYIDLAMVAPKTRSAASLTLALDLALESIILLKNNNAILPIDSAAFKHIALIGPLVSDTAADEFRAVLDKRVKLTVEKGFTLTDENKNVPRLLTVKQVEKGYKKALKAAKKADLVILYLGGDEFTAKEAYFNSAYGDRSSLDPVGQQDALVNDIKALGKPVVVALKHRRTLSINTIAEKADAILDGWDMGEMADRAFALSVVGKSVPSGKLPVTVPRSVGQLPFHYSHKTINFKKGYLFEEDGPLFPFGFGLSYSTFTYDDLKLSADSVKNGQGLRASVMLRNNGKFTAKEVAQLYIQDKVGSVLRPGKELKAFQKVELKAGEETVLHFEISAEMLAFTGLDMTRKVEAGEFVVEIGGSSADTLKQSFRVE